MLAVAIDVAELAEFEEELEEIGATARQRGASELRDRDGVAATRERGELLPLREVERAAPLGETEGVLRILDYAVFDRCPKKRLRSR